MSNNEIADYFSLLSKLMDIHGEDAFRAKSYSIAAYHIENLPTPASEMDDTTLFGMRGIGQSTGQKIREILQTGKLQQLEDWVAKTPQGVLEMMQIKGLGPKKIALLWKEHKIETVGELEYACQENRLSSIKGFGEKTQKNILESIQFLNKSKGFHLWAEVYSTAAALVENLRKTHPGHRFDITGDLRSQCESVSQITLLTDLPGDTLFQNIAKIPNVKIESINEQRSLVHIPNQPLIQVIFTKPSNYYQQLFLTTGSEVFHQAFSEAYTIPEEATSEETIFQVNQLSFIPPAMRESGKVLQRAKTLAPFQLIQPNEIRGIIHSHSTWSDGAAGIADMAKAAMDKGFEYLVLSDHSQAAYYARGLKPEQIVAQHHEIDMLNRSLSPFKIFKSIEVDILNDGNLDYDAAVLSSLDLVIASVHSNLRMTLEKAMSRILRAIENPFTNILGHPTGRLLLSREGYPMDHKELIRACARHNVVLEINAHPRRLDLDWRWVEYALEQGVLLSINPDAHAISGFDDVYYGVMAAQKGGLTKEHNLSSFNLSEFEAFLKEQRLKRVNSLL